MFLQSKRIANEKGSVFNCQSQTKEVEMLQRQLEKTRTGRKCTIEAARRNQKQPY